MRYQRQTAEPQERRYVNPGSVPPDFSFGNENNLFRLSQFKNTRRILLAFCPDGVGASCRDGMRMLREDWTQFRERDMLAIVISPAREDALLHFARSEPSPIILISDQRREAMVSYGVRGLNGPVVFFIDKDGTVKASWSHWPSNQEIFNLADSLASRDQRAA